MNSRDRCLRIPRAGDDQRAKVEHAAQDFLIDLNTLNLVDVDLDRAAANEAKLDDDALGRDCQLSGLVPDIGHDQEDQAQAECRQQDNPECDQMPQRPEADVPEMDDLLVFDQRAFNIALHAAPGLTQLGGARRFSRDFAACNSTFE